MIDHSFPSFFNYEGFGFELGFMGCKDVNGVQPRRAWLEVGILDLV